MFNENLRKLRKYLNFTVEEFAEKLEVPPRTLGAYERLERTPSIELAVLLNKKFNVNINWLISSKGNMFQNANTLMFSVSQEKVKPMKNWGRRLQKIQTANKMTDEEFSKILDISQSRLCDLCLHSKFPRAEELYKLKEHFDLSVDWLLFDEGEINPQKSKLNSLGLSEKQLSKLREMLND